MNASIQPFAIGEVSIRQLDGLFSLNDLHRASGGEEKHKPALFLRNDQAQALIEQLGKGTDLHLFLNTVKGRNGGTYACRELVIAYAAWISPTFHLKVIRVFLDATTPQAAALPYSVQPDQTLSAAQANTLRDMLKQAAERLPQHKQGPFMVQGWSKLKAHFKTDYRHIPAEQFTDAVSILARHISQPEPPMPSIVGRKWLVHFDHKGRECLTALDDDDCVLKYSDLPALIQDPGNFMQPQYLRALSDACANRMAMLLDSALDSNKLLRQIIQNKQGTPSALPAA